MDTIKNIKYLITVDSSNLVNPNIEKSVFLGKWCIPYNKREYEHIEIINFLWKDRKDYEKAYFYCIDTFEKVLLELAEVINNKFDTNHDTKYYRIILSAWLIHYIQQAYDKYLSIQSAYKQNPDLVTYILKDNNYYIPIDYNDFISKVTESTTYNLQQYSQIIKYFDFDFEYIDVIKKNIQIKKYLNKRSRSKYIINKIFSFFSSFFYASKKLITITNPYFMYDKYAKYKLLIKNKFKFILDDFDYKIEINLKIDNQKRKNTKSNEISFYNYLSENILNDIPLIYFENLKQFSNKIQNLNIKKTNINYTANAHYGNEAYKFFMAQNNSSLTTIIAQHGGVNGTHLLSLEEIDHKLFDYVFTFGWKNRNKELPMYSFNISLLKNKFNHRPIKNKILFISTGQPQVLFRMHSSYTASEYEILIKQSVDFLTTIKSNVIYRKYPNHYGWNTEEEISSKIFKPLNYDINKKIVQSYESSDIIVSNHIGSVYLETISLNIPTVVFCDQNITKFRESANDVYELLSKVGIFHPDGKSASNFINLLYETNSLKEWWNSTEVNKAKNMLIHRYSNTTNIWFDKFINRIENIQGVINDK